MPTATCQASYTVMQNAPWLIPCGVCSLRRTQFYCPAHAPSAVTHSEQSHRRARSQRPTAADPHGWRADDDVGTDADEDLAPEVLTGLHTTHMTPQVRSGVIWQPYIGTVLCACAAVRTSCCTSVCLVSMTLQLRNTHCTAVDVEPCAHLVRHPWQMPLKGTTAWNLGLQ